MKQTTKSELEWIEGKKNSNRENDSQKQLWDQQLRKNLQKYQKYQKNISANTDPKQNQNRQRQKNRDKHIEKERGPTTQQKYVKEISHQKALAVHTPNKNRLSENQVFSN